MHTVATFLDYYKNQSFLLIFPLHLVFLTPLLSTPLLFFCHLRLFCLHIIDNKAIGPHDSDIFCQKLSSILWFPCQHSNDTGQHNKITHENETLDVTHCLTKSDVWQQCLQGTCLDCLNWKSSLTTSTTAGPRLLHNSLFTHLFFSFPFLLPFHHMFSSSLLSSLHIWSVSLTA